MLNRLSRMKKMDIRHLSISYYLPEQESIPRRILQLENWRRNIEIAIEQEKKINEDIHQCKGQITCNIGRIIDEIRNDDGK